MNAPDPVERLPLSLPVFQVLLSLCDGPMHGYAILTDIQERTDTSVLLGAGHHGCESRREAVGDCAPRD